MNQEQFAHYLFQGLGRPHLWLHEHDSTPYTDALLHACLYNEIYDRQCEGSRAAYLYELIQLTANPAWFRQQILDALADPDDEMDIDQLADFALEYARAGDTYARHVLYEQTAEQATDDFVPGAYQLIDLDGVDGFLFVANRLGEVVLSHPEFWDNDYLLRHLEATGAPAEIAELRNAARGKYPFALVYLDHIATGRKRQQQATKRLRIRGWPYPEIKQQLEQNSGRVSFIQLTRWGTEAADAELQQAAHDLLQQTDQERLSRYLAIFRERPFPLGFEPLLPFVGHEHKRIACGSIEAISQFQHPTVRELGFTLIQAKHQLRIALDIFIRNYQSGDEHYLAALLAQTTDVDDLHDLGFGLDDIFTEHPTPAAAGIFLELYERGPCSLCRSHFVERLIEIDCLPEWLSREGLYDAYTKTREAIRDYLQRSPAES